MKLITPDRAVLLWHIEMLVIPTEPHQALLGELPPTGHPVQVSGITLYHLQANKIIEAWNCWDRISLVELRAVFCACGTRLVARDDTALVQAYCTVSQRRHSSVSDLVAARC